MRYCLVVCSFFLLGYTRAQIINFKNYNVEDGLAQSYVLSIEQDKLGNMWFATAGGVSRFDGKKIINYSKQDGLKEGYTFCLMYDTSGKIWLGHYSGGISIYDFKKDSFYIFDHSDFINNYTVSRIYKDNKGNIWITTFKNGIFLYRNDEILHLDNSNGLPVADNSVFDVIEDKKGNIWLATSSGIIIYDNNDEEYDTPEFIIDSKNGLITEKIRSMFLDNTGNMWIGSGDNGFFIIPATALDRPIGNISSKIIYPDYKQFKNISILTIQQDKDGYIWVGGRVGGVIKCFPVKSKDQSIKVLRAFTDSNGLPTDKIWTLYEDREGNMWIGTYGGGVSKYSGELFESYSTNEGLIYKEVFAICQDSKNDFWIGTSGGGISKFSYSELSGILTHQKDITSDVLGSDNIRAIVEDHKKNIWIGTWGKGAVKINIHTGTKRIYTEEDGLKSNFISAIAVGKKGNVYIGTTKGLNKYITAKDNFEVKDIADGQNNINVRSMYVDKDNAFWIATQQLGLVKMENGIFSFPKGLPENLTIYCITEDKANNLWIGTSGDGIYKLSNNQKLSNINTKNGLSSDDVYLITCDNNNNLWVGTSNGVDKIDFITDRIKHYGKKEGFLGIETNLNAVCKDKDRNLWFGTIDGFIKCNVDFDRINNIPPITYISNIDIKNWDAPIKNNDITVLPYYANEITIDWMGVSHSQPDEVVYKYMLSGKDEDWRAVTKNNHFTYTNLDPGRYTFMLKAANNDKIWNTEPILFKFEITPPWYKTIPAYIAFVISITFIIYVFIKYRLRQIEQEKKILEDKVNERTAELVKEKEKVEEQKTVIELKNKDITDSIEYAKKIQDAILPSQSKLKEYLPENFILFRPRDIVSGDFYWFTHIKDQSIIAAVDCTGHGVPGGFMSMIGNTLLNKIVSEQREITPAKILNRLREEVIIALKQHGGAESDAKDGMDMAICMISDDKKQLQYSGAFNPLYLIRDGNLLETKADKQPIGTYYYEQNVDFTNHVIELQKKDSIYIFSDGYADQFGGPNEKKFRTKSFKELLLKMNKKSMPDQKSILEKTIIDWMGNVKQIDDILVIGVRI